MKESILNIFYTITKNYKMKDLTLFVLVFTILLNESSAQLSPAITNWLINSSGIMGSHYVQGNSNVIQDNVPANVQTVQYSNDWVYISTNGIPAYPTGPFLDGNPSLATSQNGIFKISLNPTPNTGTPTPTNAGNIGIFINGVALFDYRDGVAWNPTTSALCGGPGNPPCPGGPTATMDWNRDAVVAERIGFDCSKGHPAQGNYHHHQNPSAFNLDLVVISNVCNLYAANGLYVIDSTKHSPLIGYAYDGYPIYGAYGYKNADGSGGITRIKSSYSLRNITTRTTHYTGVSVTTGPPVSSTYPLGYFREDYQFNIPTSEDYLDIHNGRFCVTPEYPQGTYAYFTTVDQNWNSAYPYVVGPTFYGVKTGAKVNSITESVTTYTGGSTSLGDLKPDDLKIILYPNPASEIAAIQIGEFLKENLYISLHDVQGKLVDKTILYQGSTIAFFDLNRVYDGEYFVQIQIPNGKTITKSLIVNKFSK
jgi:hypothetical protein